MDDYTDLEKAGFELNIARKALEDFRDALNRLPPEIKAALLKEADEEEAADPRQAQLPDREKGLVDRENRPL